MPPVLGPVSPSPSRLWSWAAGSRSSCAPSRSEEHTSELQSQSNLVCRLLLEKKKQSTALLLAHTHAPPALTQSASPRPHASNSRSASVTPPPALFVARLPPHSES